MRKDVAIELNGGFSSVNFLTKLGIVLFKIVVKKLGVSTGRFSKKDEIISKKSR